MTEHTAYCGMDCSKCPIFIASKYSYDERAVIAAKYTTPEHPLTADDLQCDGCCSSGNLYRFCSECAVRICGLSKKVTVCAQCSEYPCVELENMFEKNPGTREKLDELYREYQTKKDDQ